MAEATIVRCRTSAGRARCAASDGAATIGKLITGSGVRDLMRAQGIKSVGHNVVVYWAQPDARFVVADSGIAVDIGAEITKPFLSSGLICAASIRRAAQPSIRRMSVPYEMLGASYASMDALVEAQGLRLRDLSGEIYGHWNEQSRSCSRPISITS